MGKVEGVDVVAEEVDVNVGPKDLHQQHATDAHHVGPLNDDETGRDVPQFMLPGTRKENHKEKPVHPLFQAGAFGRNDDVGPSSISVDGCNMSLRSDSSDVDAENMIEHPTSLAVNHFDGPHHQSVNQLADWPIT